MSTELLTYPGYAEGTVADLVAFLRLERQRTPPPARERIRRPVRPAPPVRRPVRRPARSSGRPAWVQVTLAASAVLGGLGLASGFVAVVVTTVGLGLWVAGCVGPTPDAGNRDVVWVEGTPPAGIDA